MHMHGQALPSSSSSRIGRSRTILRAHRCSTQEVSTIDVTSTIVDLPGSDADHDVRIAAIENLMIAVLAKDTGGAIDLARTMAAYLADDPDLFRSSRSAEIGDQMSVIILHASRLRTGRL